MTTHHQKVYLTEREARRYLETRGHTILSQDYRTDYGEIDIISTQNKNIYFIEVKEWNTISPEFLVDSITQKKRERALSAAISFMKEYPEFEDFIKNFDIIFVKNKNITYYSNYLEVDNFES